MKDSIHQNKPAKKQKEDDEDPFKCLPVELILSLIFDKISEAKSLCRCSLVSKHFSSLIFRSHHNVSIKIPPLISNQMPDFSRDLSHHISWPKVIHVGTISLTGFIQASSSAYASKFVTVLRKFKSMKSLYVEYECSGGLIDSKNESLVKWKLHLKSAKYILLVAPGTSPDLVATDGKIIGKIAFVFVTCIILLLFSLMLSNDFSFTLCDLTVWSDHHLWFDLCKLEKE